MIIEEVMAPIWANAAHTAINCSVKFQGFDTPVPFTAVAEDTEKHGREIFAACLKGEAGDIADYIPPVIDWQALAEQEREARLSTANTVTADWRTELQLGIIDDADRTSLTAWMGYTKKLRSLEFDSVTDEESYNAIDWPEPPAG